MFASALLFCAITFAESKTLAVQICLDRELFSCNVIDGQWGRKSERALARYVATRRPPGTQLPTSPEEAFDRLFSGAKDLFRTVTVTETDLAAIVTIPSDPAERAKLQRMGYESIREMFAERGHVSQRALERLNPGVDFSHIAAGARIVIPNFSPIAADLKSSPGGAAQIVIDIANFEVSALDANGGTMALFPCSIAKSKSKLPPAGEMKVLNVIALPNYTYTPDFTPRGKRPKRYVWPGGENCPIGVAWLGLNLPGYGIHGTPRPETIGRAESHGCFRLANWNAARLHALCPPGTPVFVRP